MIKKILIIFFSFCTFLYSINVVDSLKANLEKGTYAEKHKILLELSNELVENYDLEALTYADQSLMLANVMKVDSLIAISHKQIGDTNVKLGFAEKAIEHYKKSIEYSIKMNDQKRLAKLYNNIAYALDNQNKFDEALEYRLESLEIKEKIGSELDIAITKLSIGNSYINSNKIIKARELYLQSLTVFEKENFIRGLINCYSNLALTYTEEQKYPDSMEFLVKSYNLVKENGMKHLMHSITLNIANNYFLQEKFESALGYYQETYNLRKAINNPSDMIGVLHGLASTEFHLKKYTKALEHSQESLNIALETNTEQNVMTNIDLIAKIYVQQGHYKKASTFLLDHIDKIPALYEKMYSNELADLQTKYEVGQKENEITQLKNSETTHFLLMENEKAMNRYLKIILILSFFLFVILIFYIIDKSKDKKAILLEKEASEKLLRNMLPQKVITDFRKFGTSAPHLYSHNYENVTVILTDFINFTQFCATRKPIEIITELNEVFTEFDNIMKKFSCERIKTIGDSYLAVSGMQKPNKSCAQNMLNAAIEILDYCKERGNQNPENSLKIRIGLHTGDIVGGIVGIEKYVYDVFGDTINTVSRIESACKPMQIFLSEMTYVQIVAEDYKIIQKDKINVKGKGEIIVYSIDKKRSKNNFIESGV